MTDPIRSILVACDFSSQSTHAANLAALLAREHDAQVRLLTVVRETLLADIRKHLGSQNDATTRVVDAARAELDALAAGLKAIAEVSEAILRCGEIEPELLAAADHSDVLMLGARGSSRSKDFLVGTTAERLLLRARRPMIVVRQEPRTAFRRVFIAVDFSMQSWAALEFAARIAPTADFHVFHALEGSSEEELRHAGLSAEAMPDLTTQDRRRALANVQNMIEKTGLPTARVRATVEAGNPRHLVYEAAAAWNASVIIIGKQGHNARGEMSLGGVTRYALLYARCDVAVVPDFSRP